MAHPNHALALKLVRYLRSHGVKAWTGRGRIHALAVGTRNGEPWQQWEVIETSFAEVQRWLGY